MSVLGAPRERPLLAPLFAALAAEVEELDVAAFLADPGRRARVYADLWRSLRPDVLVVDSGSGWDENEIGRALMEDLLARVRAVAPEPTLLGVVLRGPASTAAQAAGTAAGEGGGQPPARQPPSAAAPPVSASLNAAVQRSLVAARAAAQAGAQVIFVREDLQTAPEGYERATAPLWGSLKFFRAEGVLVTPAGWGVRGPLPCSPEPTTEGAYGLAVLPGEAAPAHDGRCVLLTHTEDLAGHVPIRDLQDAVARL